MRNPLQEQLLKAGLAKKSKIDQVAREQAKLRHGKSVASSNTDHAESERLRLEKIERDRALAAERNAQARLLEQRAQVRQIVEQTKLPIEGEIDYRFECDGAIRSLRVTEPVRRHLSKGVLGICRFDASYAIIPRATIEKIETRDPTMIVLDHSRKPPTADAADDDFYSQFKVPDDLIW